MAADRLLVLRPDDDVAIATADLPAGTTLAVGDASVVVSGDVPRGHKLALRAVRAGDVVHKYGQSIGRATADIEPGDHVHSHNLGMDQTEREHEFGTVHATLPPAPAPARMFQGFRRADGRVGTLALIHI